MKKRIALLLAVVMMITALPMGVFAKSSASVVNTVTVKEDVDMYNDEFVGTRTDLVKAPRLTITANDDMLDFTEPSQAFRLKLTNAEFMDNDQYYKLAIAGNATTKTYFYDDGNNAKADIYVPIVASDVNARKPVGGVPQAYVAFNVYRYTATSVELQGIDTAIAGAGLTTYNGMPVLNNLLTNDKISISLESVAKTAGLAQVEIDGQVSKFNSQNATKFATIVGSSTIIEISDTKDLEDKTNYLDNVVIDEVVAGTFSFSNGRTIELRAPSGFDLGFNDAKSGAFGSAMSGGKSVPVLTAGHIEFRGGLTGKVTPAQFQVDVQNNVIRLNFIGSTISETTTPGTIIIKNLTIKPTSDAKYGDVTLKFSGSAGISNQSVKIGAYKDYGVSFEAAKGELPIIVAGKFDGPVDNNGIASGDDAKALEVTLKEVIPNSWWKERKTEFTFADGIKLRGAMITVEDVASGHLINKETIDVMDVDNAKLGAHVHTRDGKTTTATAEITETTNTSKLTLSSFLSKDASTKAKVKITFFVSAKPGFEGEVYVTAKGAALGGEDMKVAIAKVVAPIKVTTKQTLIKIGFKNIPAQEITIQENVAGALAAEYRDKAKYEDAYTALWIGEKSEGDKGDLRFAKPGKAEVTAGDIVIDDYDVDNSQLALWIKSTSTEPSTIKLSGVELNVDRTPPEGLWALSIGHADDIAAKGLVANYRWDKNDDVGGLFTTPAFVLKDAYNVVTSAPGSESTWSQEASMTFVDGMCTAIATGDKVVELSPAAFISEDNRTMMPLRSVAIALNISENNISWYAPEKRATITHNGKTVSVIIGSSALQEYGVAVADMGSKAVIVEGRTFIPLAAISRALGVSYLWDQDSKTAVFNPTSVTIAKYPGAVTVQGNTAANAVVTSESVQSTEATAGTAVVEETTASTVVESTTMATTATTTAQ